MTNANWLGVKIAAFVVLMVLGSERTHAMGMEQFGPAGEHVTRQPDWPDGVVELLRHPARVYWNWINGSERAFYAGDVAAVNELLALYSQVELGEHPVVMLAGKREAESFHGKSTPYVVQFDLPGRLQLSVRRLDGTAALYQGTPRMIIAVDSKLAEQLDELQIPPNVTLESTAIEVEKAIEFSGSANPALRREAIEVLGLGEQSTPEILAVFERASSDEEAGVRAAAEAAQKRLTATNDSVESELRTRVKEFVEQHAHDAATGKEAGPARE